jgi:hypothetical protein
MRHSVRWFVDLGRLGPEFSRVLIDAGNYLDRYILYIFGATLRLHKFWRGDDNRAPHDHPWWFITFPLVSYVERYWTPYSAIHFSSGTYSKTVIDGVEFTGDIDTGFYATLEWYERTRTVKAWRFHFRPAKFRHIVVGRADGKTTPFWTFVISGRVSNRRWGFWKTPDQFIPHEEWK